MMNRAKEGRSDVFEIAVTEGLNTCLSLENEWNSLFSRASGAAIHMSFPWASSWAQREGEQAVLNVLTVRANGELVGLLPLTVARFPGVRIARLLGSGHGYLGVLVCDDVPEVATVLAREIGTIADCLVMNDVSNRDECTNIFIESLKEHGWNVKRRRRNIVWVSVLESDYKEFLSKYKSSKSRQTLRRKERLLEKAHDVGIQRYFGTEVDDSVVYRCADIHAKSWMKKRGGAFLCEPFYQEMVKKCANSAMIDVWIMTIDGADAAFVVSGLAHGVYYYEWPAFKLEYASEHSIGQILLAKIFAAVCQESYREFDFGPGDGDYKRFWGNREQSVDRVVTGRGNCGRIVASLVAFAWILAENEKVRKLYRKCQRVLSRRTQLAT